jgi:hypothetical protein
MKYAIKGTDNDWNEALNGAEIGSTGVLQVQNGKMKRKLNQEDIDKEAGTAPKSIKKKKNRRSKK